MIDENGTFMNNERSVESGYDHLRAMSIAWASGRVFSA